MNQAVLVSLQKEPFIYNVAGTGARSFCLGSLLQRKGKKIAGYKGDPQVPLNSSL